MARWREFGLAGGLVVLWLLGMSGTAGAVGFISPAELNERLGDPGLVILDVSPPGTYATYDRKIKGAGRELPGQVDEWYRKYPPEKTLVLYCHCHDEFASRRVAQLLEMLGRTKVLVLQGGWEAWEKAGYPTEPK